ncbi:50S ribosomal protein L30 [Candidatus Zinderia endosymbiont of Aphrophora alni]|uniref:50S ribosomal protein L30 n=1 Tax=Candidatus Zinderia endosymbiont of Aphrophora alni TaxID=3077951 RepID=UPI0030D1AFCA
MKKIKIKLIKSLIGINFKHRATIYGLGLKKINSICSLKDNKIIRGMIKKISYLIKIL